jgi:hypothetical protein
LRWSESHGSVSTPAAKSNALLPQMISDRWVCIIKITDKSEPEH